MIIKKYIELFKNLIYEIKFRKKLEKMDACWEYLGGYCFDLFPPSFYYTHTEEEIKRITEETIAMLYAKIEELDD